MSDTAAHIPITGPELDKFTEKASLILAKVEWTPQGDRNRSASATDSRTWRDSSIPPVVPQSFSMIRIAKALSNDPLLISESVNHVLHCVRQGLRIGMHISALFTKFSGLERLISLNTRGGLSESQKTEFREKYASASAITLFSAASYAVWALSDYRTEEVASVQSAFPGITEIHLASPVRALDCMIWYYAASLERPDAVHTEPEMIALTLRYFQGILDEIKNRENSLKYTEFFTDRSYRLEGSDFRISGFEILSADRSASVEFNRVELGQIVGNRDAKHKARRLAERLLCYDPETRRNPMHDLGGLATLRMGHGEPGTGKSLQIAATATLLHDYCKRIGIPFLFWPMPDNLISTFQGGSGERALEWMKPLRDPGRIIYAPVDDAENNLEERTRQGVSAGVREVIGVFLRHTEGAYAVNHGNAVVELFTNLPEQLDRAVLSRIRDRFYIGGAMTPEDFLDQDYLWWRKFQEMVPDFINMEDPPDHIYLAGQQPARNLSAIYEKTAAPASEKIREIFDQVKSRHTVAEQNFFAHFFHEIKKAYPGFSSRDVRNIQNAVTERIMDFDFPPEWLDDPPCFFLKDYDTKKAMIVEQMKAAMQAISFAEVRLQETIRYVENMAKITGAEAERKLGEMISQMRLQEEAVRRVSEMKWRAGA